MPLESATYISDLDPTNPVGSSDLVSSLDDHMRLVKATLKNTFPNIDGAVTATEDELNHLDGVTGTTGTGKLVLDNTPTIANLTVTDSITLPAKSVSDAALSDNVALLDEAVAFESTLSVAGAATFSSTIAVTGDATIGGNLTLTGTLNGVNVTDFARKPQENTFLGTTQTVSADNANWRATNGTVGVKMQALSTDVPELGFVRNTGLVGTETNHALHFLVNNRSRGSIGTDGSFHLPIVATSTSTTLVAGQVHAITSNATLPNMATGEWVGVINNSASPITVTKNASDTMYWTASGASVTSVTIPPRGKATFFCADGGNIYASGNITGAS